MNTQPSVLGSGGGWGMIATGLWTALLGLGSWAMLTVTTLRPLRMVLGLSLSGQLLLHILYGGETFLYSLHFVPLLILPVALSCITPARIFARSLTVLLILTAGVNNIHQLHLAQVRLGEYGAIWQHYGSKSVECPVPLLRWVAEPEKISL